MVLFFVSLRVSPVVPGTLPFFFAEKKSESSYSHTDLYTPRSIPPQPHRAIYQCPLSILYVCPHITTIYVSSYCPLYTTRSIPTQPHRAVDAAPALVLLGQLPLGFYISPFFLAPDAALLLLGHLPLFESLYEKGRSFL